MKSVSSELQVSTSIVTLQPGLYAFRYQAAKPEAGRMYAASLARAPMGTGKVEFFGSDAHDKAGGTGDAELRHLEDCVVVRVSQDTASVLIAEYFADRDALQGRVAIVIDRLDGPQVKNKSKTSDAAPALPYSLKTLSAFGDVLPLRLLGHIERKGDVSVAQGWLGDPQGTARMEGFMAEWAQQAPTDLELYYGCAASGQNKINMVPVGTFAGTRGKALPVNVVCFDLKGKNREQYKLIGQAVFAGAAPMTIQAGKVLSGPNGNEPLVAFYLVAIRTRQKADNKKSAWEDPSVTQVFRKKEKK